MRLLDADHAGRARRAGRPRQQPGARRQSDQSESRHPDRGDADQGHPDSGEYAEVDTRNGVVKGKVSRISPASSNGTVGVDIMLEGALPPGARPDLSVDGTVRLEELNNIIYVGRPAFGQENSSVSLFKVGADGEAVRTTVKLGRSSVSTIEVVEGLAPGDQAILSDMSTYDEYQRVRLSS